MQHKKIGYMDYKDGILYIVSGKDRMFFPCDNEFAGKIMDSVKKSYAEFYDNLRAQQERRVTSKPYATFDSYEKIGVVEDVTIYVKCISYESKLFRFEYYSDKMYTRHGCTQVDITMDI